MNSTENYVIIPRVDLKSGIRTLFLFYINVRIYTRSLRNYTIYNAMPVITAASWITYLHAIRILLVFYYTVSAFQQNIVFIQFILKAYLSS